MIEYNLENIEYIFLLRKYKYGILEWKQIISLYPLVSFGRILYDKVKIWKLNYIEKWKHATGDIIEIGYWTYLKKTLQN